MSKDDDNQEKVKELVKLMAKFAEETPLALPVKKENIVDKEPVGDFTIVETSRTITYTQKEWNPYGKLVRYPQ